MPLNGFTSSLQLIEHIKSSKYGDWFCVGAACYPEGHPNKTSTITEKEVQSLSVSEAKRYSRYTDPESNAVSYLVCKDNHFAEEIAYLKEKVNAGATFLITQMFFDVQVFIEFFQFCRQSGITVPIIPGLMLVGSYGGFKRMTKMCKTRVPEEIESAVEALKADDEGLKEYGVKLGVKMACQLLEFGVIGLHFYTLNSSVQTTKILDQLRELLPLLNLGSAAGALVTPFAIGTLVRTVYGVGTVEDIAEDGSIVCSLKKWKEAKIVVDPRLTLSRQSVISLV